MVTLPLEQTESELIDPERVLSVPATTGLANLINGQIVISDSDSLETRSGSQDDASIDLDTLLSGALSRQSEKYRAESLIRTDDAQVLHNLAQSLLLEMKFDEAISHLHRAIEVDGDFIPAWATLIKALLANGQEGDAVEEGENALKLFPESVLVMNALASAYSSVAKHDKAIELYSKLLRQNPGDFTARYNRAALHLTKRSHQMAIADLRRVLRDEPRFAPAYNAMGVCYLMQNATKKAEHWLEVATRLEPEPEWVRNLAHAYRKSGKQRDMIRTLEPHMERYPLDDEARELLAGAYRESGDRGQCLALLASLVARRDGPNETSAPRLLNNFGVVLAELGRVQPAIEYLQRSLSLAVFAPAFRNLARVLIGVGEIAEAKQLYDLRRDEYPDAFTAAFGARLQELAGNYKAATGLYREAVSRDAAAPIGYAGLSKLLCDIDGNYQEATEILQDGLANCGNNDVLLNNLAYAQLLSGDTVSGRRTLDRIAVKASLYFVEATRGLLLLKEGNVEEGARLYNLAKHLAIPKVKSLVEQKKRIELARYWIGQKRVEKAKDLLLSALDLKTDEKLFRREAEKLLEELQESPRS